MQYLVLGADGYIGAYIYQNIIKEGLDVIGTSRRGISTNGLFYYDIRQNNIDDILDNIKDREKAAIVCIADANIDSCLKNFDMAYGINVIGTKRLINRLAMEKFHIIFFSSDNVFDGKTGNYTEESPTNPINKYGQMKAEMEQYLLDSVPECCILRIPKVVSPLKTGANVFTQWENQIDRGVIQCIRGNKLSFVSIDDLYHVCRIMAERKITGLYNVAGDVTYSRSELAQMFYNKKGIFNMTICECAVNSFGFYDNRPLNVGLNNHKFKSLTQYQFASMDCIIEQYLDNMNNTNNV
ncbi:MAG: sugar nucleotide-binding protein [Anaeroplasmataceae bacterium]|nr:sugar nucleotide-binding protein [Anaeroplasmataceae bacterium]